MKPPQCIFLLIEGGFPIVPSAQMVPYFQLYQVRDRRDDKLKQRGFEPVGKSTTSLVTPILRSRL